MTRHFVQAINIVVLRSGKVNMNVYIRNSKIPLDIMRPHSPTPMLRIEIHLMNRTCKRKQSLLQQQKKTCSVYTLPIIKPPHSLTWLSLRQTYSKLLLTLNQYYILNSDVEYIGIWPRENDCKYLLYSFLKVGILNCIYK